MLVYDNLANDLGLKKRLFRDVLFYRAFCSPLRYASTVLKDLALRLLRAGASGKFTRPNWLANIYKTPTLKTNIFLPKETTTIRRNAHALRNNASSVSVELLGLGNLLAHVANVVLAGHRSLFFGGGSIWLSLRCVPLSQQDGEYRKLQCL
jgi:hypothetical protein